MGDRHSAANQQNLFCARVPCEASCPAGTTTNYIEVCKPAWSAVMFPQRDKRAPLGARWKKYEAHHILCYSTVSGSMFAGSDQCKAILNGTKWCVNNSQNMIALPLWGHTVAWYLLTSAPPAFMNLPNHDRDHPDFTDEVKTELKKVVGEVQVEKDEHNEIKGSDIAGRLNTLSGIFEAKLRARGSRPGHNATGRVFVGTHMCIELGKENGGSDWYLPFSMSAKPSARSFPAVWKAKEEVMAAAAKLLGR